VDDAVNGWLAYRERQARISKESAVDLRVPLMSIVIVLVGATINGVLGLILEHCAGVSSNGVVETITGCVILVVLGY